MRRPSVRHRRDWALYLDELIHAFGVGNHVRWAAWVLERERLAKVRGGGRESQRRAWERFKSRLLKEQVPHERVEVRDVDQWAESDRYEVALVWTTETQRWVEGELRRCRLGQPKANPQRAYELACQEAASYERLRALGQTLEGRSCRGCGDKLASLTRTLCPACAPQRRHLVAS